MMYQILIVVLAAVLVSLNLVSAEKARFDNYRVYSIEIANEEQLRVLQQLENRQDGLSFLIPPLNVPMRVEILVPPHKFADISELCERLGIINEIKIENLQKWEKHFKFIQVHYSNFIWSN